MQIELKELDDTRRFANWVVQHIKRGQVICLVGDLGAGKTTFTQFLCQALGVQEYVTSPTFNLMNTYSGVLNGTPIDLYHFDVYRVFASEEMYEIGFDEFLYGEGISIVEWANQVADMIPKDSLWITMTLTLDGKRVLTYKGQNFEGEFK